VIKADCSNFSSALFTNFKEREKKEGEGAEKKKKKNQGSNVPLPRCTAKHSW